MEKRQVTLILEMGNFTNARTRELFYFTVSYPLVVMEKPVLSFVCFVFSLPQTASVSLPVSAWSFSFLVLYLIVSPHKVAAKLTPPKAHSKNRDMNAWLGQQNSIVPFSIWFWVSGVGMIFRSFLKSHCWITCFHKSVSPSERQITAFSLQVCSISEVSKIQFWIRYKGISWKKHVCLWAWCGDCVPTVSIESWNGLGWKGP